MLYHMAVIVITQTHKCRTHYRSYAIGKICTLFVFKLINIIVRCGHYLATIKTERVRLKNLGPATKLCVKCTIYIEHYNHYVDILITVNGCVAKVTKFAIV